MAGEIPAEYTESFASATREEGWVVRPGSDDVLICGDCLRRLAGHETVDDAPKARGLKDPKSL